MKARLRRGGTAAFNQRGFAMIAFLTLVVLMSAYLIANALTQTSSDLVNTREQRNMKALLQAKAALIAYAASTDGWQASNTPLTTNQPGGLPCPDKTNTGTSAGALCSGIAFRIGRLPWATIGSDDFRDASGERLWYAVSSNYYKNIGVNDINSDTSGRLTIAGTAPANNVVAVVIAPGVPILGQNRSGSGINDPAQYLEGYSTVASDYTFTTNALPSDIFNDRVLAITQADLMGVVEPVVAARIERSIKPYLQAYFSQWGAFPFPAAFPPGPGTATTRTQSAFVGDVTQTSGLLPITATGIYIWTSGSGSFVSGGSPGPGVCSTSASPPGLQCTFSLSIGSTSAQFTVQGQIGTDAGNSFPQLPDVSDVSVGIIAGSGSIVLATIQGSLASSGAGTVTYISNFSGSCIAGCTIQITIPGVTASSLTNVADPTAGWFIANEWFRQTYYAVAPSCLPGGGGNCSAALNPCTFQCLTVKNMPAYYASPNNNKFAILVLAGRPLNGNPRPSSAPGDYLENANLTAVPGNIPYIPYVYEHRSGTPTSINDRVVVIAP